MNEFVERSSIARINSLNWHQYTKQYSWLSVRGKQSDPFVYCAGNGCSLTHRLGWVNY